jgi:hypothetical protein
MKASRRCRKIPVTRKDDFFVDSHQQKKSQGRKGGENETKTKTRHGINLSS